MFNATRFKTLMLREWLQNRWTWAVVVAALPALTLLALPFGEVSIPEKAPANLVAGGAIALSALVCTLAAWATVLFMATGLARRDVQDRSIEFWLSLPSTHGEHIGAQYLMHALVFPAAALLAGLLFGGLISPLLMLRWQGLAGLTEVAWLPVISGVVQVALLGLLSLVAAALWLSPLVMLLMAGSAWLKRLALPLLVLGSVFLANFPATRPAFRAAIEGWATRAGQLLEGVVRVSASQGDLRFQGELPGLSATGHLLQSLENMASPHFAVGLLIALACAWLIALRRRRGG